MELLKIFNLHVKRQGQYSHKHIRFVVLKKTNVKQLECIITNQKTNVTS